MSSVAGLTAAKAAALQSNTASRPSLPSEQARSWNVAERLQDATGVWISGVRDALTVYQFVFFLARSEVIRFRTLQCFMLNGVIFLGSIFLFNWAINPLLGLLRRLVQDDDAWATDLIFASFSVLYKMLWIYPIYCISFILSTFMYQEIADHALALLRQKPPKRAELLTRIINEFLRVIQNLVYIVQMYVLKTMPGIGTPLYFVFTCWLVSIYCFEYRWAHMQWSSRARLNYFERHWLYFAGFGFPVSFVTFLCPKFIDTGVFALLFPACILTATTAEPRELRKAPRMLRQLPIFAAVQGISCLVLRLFEGRLTPAMGGTEPTVGGGSSAGSFSSASREGGGGS